MPSPEAIKAAEEIHELARLPNGNYAPHLPLPSVLASVIDQAADEKYAPLIEVAHRLIAWMAGKLEMRDTAKKAALIISQLGSYGWQARAEAAIDSAISEAQADALKLAEAVLWADGTKENWRMIQDLAKKVKGE
jgi:hypothetical protein